MTSSANCKGPVQQSGQDDQSLGGSFKKKVRLWSMPSMSIKGGNKPPQTGESTPGSTARKQFSRSRSNSLVDYSDPLRTTVVLEKQDNEVYGFEVQTYGVQLKNSTLVEMCTFVSSVQEDSAAGSAGLGTGDIILTINGVSIEGSAHQDIVNLIRQSPNTLKLETVSGTVVKRIELQKKLSFLKHMLREKWVELQALTLQERRLARGNLNDSVVMPSMESLMSMTSPSSSRSQRFSSDSSCRSLLMSDSDDAAFMPSVFEEPGPFSPLSPIEMDAFFSRDPAEGPLRSQLTRTHSMSLGSSGPARQASSVFGTLPRRPSRQRSVRKNIMKFIPGLNRSVEEEESS
ncbi:cytohesin-interacting protein [Denticeps clupeoides]|uniref:cytohesin-interacting protein n=1 Tax=Denticeps clupeoides TaxID=299321 RepID=UPI0010A31BA4|nr:cytohesin-interacting protein-like [Denticeps clupeoides]